MQKWEHFTSFFKGKKCSGKIKSRRSQNTFKQKKTNVANCFEYSLLCFMLNINLTFYNIKFSVDGGIDRKYFGLLQKLKPLRKNMRNNSFFKKLQSVRKKIVAGSKSHKSVAKISLSTINFDIFFLWLFLLLR